MMNNNPFNGMFGKVSPGQCRLSMSGNIAVKTSTGYKSYNIKSGRLTNCDNFVFDIGEEYFFVIPTIKVEIGDIILVAGKPKCVINVEDNKITVINYEDSTIETILPERHMIFGSTYFYGKIVSMFGNNLNKSKKSANKMFQYMMMTEMMKGDKTSGAGNGMFSSLPMLMLMNNGGGGFDFFDGMFDFDNADDEDDTEDENDTEETTEIKKKGGKK